MKRKIFFVSVAVTAAVSTTIGMHIADSKPASSLELANIDALSQYENDKICSYQKVSMDEASHSVKCSGEGRQCCYLN